MGHLLDMTSAYKLFQASPTLVRVTSVIFLINLLLYEAKNVLVVFEVVHGYQQRQAAEPQMAR